MAKNTKEQIIAATLHRLVTHPIEPITLQAVAQDVGISKAAIYRHFVSKQDLFDTIGIMFNTDEQHLLKQLEANVGEDAVHPLVILTRNLLRHKGHFGILVHQAMQKYGDIVMSMGPLFGYPGSNVGTDDLLYREGLYFRIILNAINAGSLCKDNVEEFIDYLLQWYAKGIELQLSIDEDLWASLHVENDEIEEDRFLLAMGRVFEKYGIHGLTMQRMAKEAKLAPSSLYYSFPTKYTMVDRTAKKEIGQYFSILDVRLEKTTTLEQALQIIYGTTCSYLSQRPLLAQKFILMGLFMLNHIPERFENLAKWTGSCSKRKEGAEMLGIFLAAIPLPGKKDSSYTEAQWMNHGKQMLLFFANGCNTEEQ